MIGNYNVGVIKIFMGIKEGVVVKIIVMLVGVLLMVGCYLMLDIVWDLFGLMILVVILFLGVVVG